MPRRGFQNSKLNKKVCKACYRDRFPDADSVWGIMQELLWEEGKVKCWKMARELTTHTEYMDILIDKEPPYECPFRFEHQVTEDNFKAYEEEPELQAEKVKQFKEMIMEGGVLERRFLERAKKKAMLEIFGHMREEKTLRKPEITKLRKRTNQIMEKLADKLFDLVSKDL